MEKRAGSDTKEDPKTAGEHQKTFYFGMIENYDEKVDHAPLKDDRIVNQIHADAVDKFAESLHQKLKSSARRNNSDSSGSVLSSVAFDDEYTVRLNDDANRYEGTSDDDGTNIQVHLRPTLPRRQYDIPRFSPSAAWRTLEIPVEQHKADAKAQSTQATLSNSEDQTLLPSSPEQAHCQLEERIQRVYRDPIPGFSDNKSGDSGISGDAGLPDRPDSSSRPYNHRPLKSIVDEATPKVGPFLTPWTPQQDLNDDSSSDGAVDVNGSKEDSGKLSNCGHIFSLSLPREGNFSAYNGQLNDTYYAPKHTFNSLQKTKPSLAQVFGGLDDNGIPYENKLSIFDSDNWVLSRSAPNSIDNFNMSMSIAKGAIDDIDATHHYDSDGKSASRQNAANEFMTPLQMDIQPASFNFITSGKHMMYLPKNAVNSINNDTDRSSSNATTNNDDDLPEHIKKTLERKYSPKVDTSSTTSSSRKNDNYKNNDTEDSPDGQTNNIVSFVYILISSSMLQCIW